MTGAVARNRFPGAAAAAAAAMVAVSVLYAAAGRDGPSTSDAFPDRAVEVRELRFEDGADGSVVVLDAVRGAEVARIEPGTGGFVRGALRGFARERRAHGVGSGPPFELRRIVDGRLLLVDPSTGREADLGVFGPTNSAAFARLLTAGGRER
jgi:putative photosynthetic complex assembly protein